MKNLFRFIKKYISNRDYRFDFNAHYGFYDKMDDEEYIKRLFKAKTGKELNLDHPTSFNEKLQWLKLHVRNELHTSMVDKYEAKTIVADRIGSKYIIPTLGIWDSFEEIDFIKLPNEFVLKPTHTSGGITYCNKEKGIDIRKIRSRLNKRLRQNYYYRVREWPYKNLKPRIIAEPLIIDDENNPLIPYKVFNFGGEPRIIQVIQGDKTSNETIDYFDTEWNLLELTQNYANSIEHVKKPCCLKEMLRLSGELSRGFPFLRTDWYVVNGKLLFSEFTFFSDAGMENFHPESWDALLGSWLDLNGI